MVRDYFELERGIVLPDFERNELWWERGENLYLENFKRAGFSEVPVEELAPGDGILFQVRAPVINHAAIYLGDDIILHHVMNRLSRRDIFSGFWKRCARLVVRYK